MNDKARDWFTRSTSNIPTAEELQVECGSLAFAIFGNKMFSYHRDLIGGKQEVVIVVNGKVHGHYICDNHKPYDITVPAVDFEGQWAWGLGLKRKGFHIEHSSTLLFYMNSITKLAERLYPSEVL